MLPADFQRLAVWMRSCRDVRTKASPLPALRQLAEMNHCHLLLLSLQPQWMLRTLAAALPRTFAQAHVLLQASTICSLLPCHSTASYAAKQDFVPVLLYEVSGSSSMERSSGLAPEADASVGCFQTFCLTSRDPASLNSSLASQNILHNFRIVLKIFLHCCQVRHAHCTTSILLRHCFHHVPHPAPCPVTGLETVYCAPARRSRSRSRSRGQGQEQGIGRGRSRSLSPPSSATHKMKRTSIYDLVRGQ